MYTQAGTKPQALSTHAAAGVSREHELVISNLEKPNKSITSISSKTLSQPKISGRNDCSKCSVMTKKLKKESENCRNLQRQNGCLEGIITQKVLSSCSSNLETQFLG
jgi:hypothetical protein